LGKEELQARTIYLERDADRDMCIRREEVKLLLDEYPTCTRFRVAFMIAATCGLRSGEISNPTNEKLGIRIEGLHFNKQTQMFDTLTYTIAKPVVKIFKNGVRAVIFKKRTVPIRYQQLQKELTLYVLKNYKLLKDERLFSFHKDELNKQLQRLRNRVKKVIFEEQTESKYYADEYRGFAQVNGQIYIGGEYKSQYRISPHSLRRFYNTWLLWCQHGGNIILTTKDLGHTKIDTNLIYSFAPERIGLTEEHLKDKATFDMIFLNIDRKQKTLQDWGF